MALEPDIISTLKSDNELEELARQESFFEDVLRHKQQLLQAQTHAEKRRSLGAVESMGDKVLDSISRFQNESLEQAAASVGDTNWERIQQLLEKISDDVNSQLNGGGFFNRLLGWLLFKDDLQASKASIDDHLDDLTISLKKVADEQKRLGRLGFVLQKRFDELGGLVGQLNRTLVLGMLLYNELQEPDKQNLAYVRDELLPALLYRLQSLQTHRVVIQQGQASLLISRNNYAQMSHSAERALLIQLRVLVILALLIQSRDQALISLGRVADRCGVERQKIEGVLDELASCHTDELKSDINRISEQTEISKPALSGELRSELRKTDLLFSDLSGEIERETK